MAQDRGSYEPRAPPLHQQQFVAEQLALQQPRAMESQRLLLGPERQPMRAWYQPSEQSVKERLLFDEFQDLPLRPYRRLCAQD